MSEINNEAMENLEDNYLYDDELDDVSGGKIFGDGSKQLVYYTVVRGDTLIGIARKFNTTWKLIQKQNPVDAKEPRKIRPGMVLKFYANNY